MLRDSMGKRLHDLRRDLGLTQTELRDRMEKNYGTSVGQNYISQLEGNNSQPSWSVAVALARALDTSIDYLAMLTDDPRPAGAQAEAYITPEAEELARTVDELPADARQELLSIARRLARPVPGRAEREREVLWWLNTVEQVAGVEVRRRIENAVMKGKPPFGMSD